MSYPNDTHWCGAKPGEPHKDWDDVACCYISGQQLICCDMWEVGVHECHPSIWDGDYPGAKQAERYGLFHTHLGVYGPDVSTVYRFGVWNIETQQHEIPEETLKKIQEERGLQV